MRQDTVIECVDIKWNHNKRIIAIAILEFCWPIPGTYMNDIRARESTFQWESIQRDHMFALCDLYFVYNFPVTSFCFVCGCNFVFSFFFFHFRYLHQCLNEIERTCTQYKPQSNQKWFIILHIRFHFIYFFQMKQIYIKCYDSLISVKSLGYR